MVDFIKLFLIYYSNLTMTFMTLIILLFYNKEKHAELRRAFLFVCFIPVKRAMTLYQNHRSFFGGDSGVRTCDLTDVNRAL